MAEEIDIRFSHTSEIAAGIQTRYHFAKDAGDQLYYYDGKVYVAGGEGFIRGKVFHVMKENGFEGRWTTRKGQEVVELIRIQAPDLWPKPSSDKIIVRNGVLDLHTREQEDHSPDNRTTVYIPVNYSARAKCPAWEEFVGQVFPPDTRQLAWEIPAWLMTPNVSIQKAILLYGEGSNGKSTYLKAVMAFLGHQNVAGLSLQRLELDRFSASGLYGKLANICPDLPSQNLENTSMFKAITGGDMITGERKYRDTFSFTPFSRLVFSANHLPHSYDGGYAYFRRWNIIHFPNQFEGSKAADPEVLDAKLASQGELSGVLNKAIDAWQQLQRRPAFSESRSQEELMKEFEAVSDPFSTWVQRHIHQNPKATTPKHIFINAYNEAHSDKAPLPAITFGLRLQRLMPDLKDVQKMSNGKRDWCYEGIEYRS